ncbi:MAG: 5'/3'-nucleotidase SurE [Candidatus Muirbacterium halophilum]|nr:5'/3'-nucleotidase SurE [Candidatus Muirbacterium halophilum]MCK9475301.1 5'/3'-nucleotidase SurE [Candidatus Muirbacterium halophilum]
MNFLLVNDDGIKSKGIESLAWELSKRGKVFIFSPETEKSASGSAMTINNSIIIKESHNFPVKVEKAFVLENGFPVDCAKTGIFALKNKFNITIDLIVSGINRGENTGIDLRYSGTVGAAFDGIEKKIPSIAVSLASYDFENPRFLNAAAFTGDFIDKNYNKIKHGKWKDYLFNINYPDCDNVTEYEFTKPADFYYEEYYEIEEYSEHFRMMLRGKRIFDRDFNKGTDLYAIENGKVSISLIRPEYKYDIPEKF